MVLYFLFLLAVFGRSGSALVDDRFIFPDDLPPASDTLRYAFIIFRHGIRTPVVNIYGSEEDYKKIWPEGKGILTEAGERLMLHVGKSLRRRYGRLVPKYEESRVTVTSTLSPRASQSAEAVTWGLFPGVPQPVPISRTASYDKVFIFEEKEGNTVCPRYNILKYLVKKDEDKRTTEDMKKLYRELNEHLKKSKWKKKEIKNLDDLFVVWDTALMENLNLKTTENWTEPYLPAMAKVSLFNVWSLMNGKTNMLQYFTGPFLYQIFKEMADRWYTCLTMSLVGLKCPVFLHLHGSHDITLDPLFWALTGEDVFVADPGHALILEVHENEDVKMFSYWALAPDPSVRFLQISLNKVCNQDTCNLPTYMKALKQLTFPEPVWDLKCRDLKGIESEVYRNVGKEWNVYDK